jgi:hypothetical protein
MTIEIAQGSLPLVLEGRFKPWSIDAGHSKILLRGFLGDYESEEPPRIFDVLFQDVFRIAIADRYEGLEVTVADADAMRSEELRVGGNWRGSKMHLLGGQGSSDYIVAGFLFWAEVAVRAIDPSPLMEELPALGSVKGKVYRA